MSCAPPKRISNSDLWYDYEQLFDGCEEELSDGKGEDQSDKEEK